MNLLMHVMRADARRLRWFIIVWLLLLATATAVSAAQPRFVYDVRLYESVGLAAVLLAFAVKLGVLVMVPTIVQSDPAVGTDAFWMTRPIPRGTLSSAKILLACVILVLAPAIAFSATWAALHVSAAEVAGVSIEMLLWGLMWVAIFLAASIVTANFARFALLIGGAVGAAALGVIVLLTIDRFTTAAPILERPLPQPFDPTPLLAAELVVIAAAFTVVALQYRTRLRRVSVPMGAVGLVLAFVIAGHWPIPLLRARWRVPSWAERSDAPQLTGRATGITFERPAPGLSENPWRPGRLELELARVEPGWEAKASLLAGSITLPNGRVIQSGGNAYLAALGGVGTRESPASTVARQVLGVQRVLGVHPPMAESNAIVIQTRARDLEGLDGTTGVYRGRFAVALTQWNTVGTLPLSPGATFDDGTYRFSIADVITHADQVAVRARESRVTSWFDRQPRRTYELYLRNMSRSEAIPASVFELSAGAPLSTLFGITVSSQQEVFNRGVEVRVPGWWAPQQGGPPVDRDWFAAAELVFVRTTEAAVVERTFDSGEMTIVVK